MKKWIFICLIFMKLSFGFAQVNFNYGSINNSFTLTCQNPVITMTASSAQNNVNYTWVSGSVTVFGNYANISQPGVWAVTAQIANSNSVSTQNFTVYQNTNSPTVVTTPTLINIPCNVSASTFTGTSTGHPNVSTNWYRVFGTSTVYVGVPQGSLNLFQPTAPGTYYFVGTNNTNGCSSTKTVQVTASLGVPIFTLTSPSSFTFGCGTASVTSMQVSSVQTSPSVQPVSYAFAPPPGTATPVFSSNSNLNNISVPGTYVVYVKDNTSLCQVSQSVTISSNTIAPIIFHDQSHSILSCKQSTLLMEGLSTSTNVAVTWTVPASPSPSVVSSNTVIAITNPTVAGSSTSITTAGIYTVSDKNNNTQCSAVKTVQVNQDLRVPSFSISPLTNSVITCAQPSVLIAPIMSTLVASSTVPTFTWYPPSGPPSVGPQHQATVAGTYTSDAVSSVNGCSFSATYNVLADNALAMSNQTIAANCPFSFAVVLPNYQNGTSGLSFNWLNPQNTIISPLNQSTVVVNAVGDYTCIVTNTVSNCTNTFVCKVVCSTGLHEFDMLQSVYIYPNPAENYLFIKRSEPYHELTLQIFAADGRLMKSVKIDNEINRVNLDLASGVYIYKLTTNEGSSRSGKIIVK